jgi:alpha-galactosidase
MQTALSGGEPGGCEPLDWLNTTAPRLWRLGTEKAAYHWEGPSGANPMHI